MEPDVELPEELLEELLDDVSEEEVFVDAESEVLDFASDFAPEEAGAGDEGFSASMAFFRDSEG